MGASPTGKGAKCTLHVKGDKGPTGCGKVNSCAVSADTIGQVLVTVDTLWMHSPEEGHKRKLGGTTPTWGFLHRSCVILYTGRVNVGCAQVPQDSMV